MGYELCEWCVWCELCVGDMSGVRVCGVSCVCGI